MKHIVFIGSHLGYPMDRTPLGGGAMVGLHLSRHWAGRKDFKLTLLGSGPVPPDSTAEYIRLPKEAPESLIRLSEFGYARFCRDFERETTDYLSAHRDSLPPRDTVVVVNDISEGPDVAEIAKMGYSLLSIWHVDVVDYFNKMYLRNWVAPDRLTRTFDRLGSLRLQWAVPDILRLVFEKQSRTVAFSRRLVVPSKRMAETIIRCYGDFSQKHLPGVAEEPLEQRIRVIPWGGWHDEVRQDKVEEHARRLKAQYHISPKTRVLMMLCRIAPEKGIHLLLEALRIIESSPSRPVEDLCLFMCGEPAFMRGRSYNRQIQAAAKRLKKFKVYFPGYLSPEDKQAYFSISNLFISPSIHESYGLSIVEALQAGLPVLASDHSGVDEILSPGFSRVVSYNGSLGIFDRTLGKGIPKRLAEALKDLLRDPEKLRQMGVAAKQAAETMTFAAAAQKLADAALEIVSN